MKKIFVSIVLIATFFALLAIIYNEEYGANYNDVRSRLDIPTVDVHWQFHREIFLSKLIYTNYDIKSNRYHLKKTITISLFNRIKEEDDYYIIEDKKIAIDADYTYGQTQPWVIKYYVNKPTGLVKYISRHQLSDTLKKYLIK